MILSFPHEEPSGFAVPALDLTESFVQLPALQKSAFEQDPKLVPSFANVVLHVDLVDVEHVVAFQDFLLIQPDCRKGVCRSFESAALD